ncbi:MAG TPA: hypothetical protein VGM82_00755 [Gemmatimonadaceae bacterium]|jgi:hypothetical protein
MTRRLLIATLLALPTTLVAQTDTTQRATQRATPPRDTSAAKAALGPPVRKIATASAVSTEQLGNIANVRELSGGRLLVNDGQRRRLLLMDSTLRTISVVLDSLTEVVDAYGVRQGTLMAYRGDSSLFFDPTSYALLILDGEGHTARVRSIPRVRDASWLTQNNSYGWPGIDTKGRLVYRIPAEAGPPLVAPPRGVPWFPQDPDSAFIVAIDFDTRKLDTLGSIRKPKEPYIVKRTPTGGFNFISLTNPLPSTDDWALLSDGTVAFVRGRDYRVEFLGADGQMTSSPKLAFDWQAMNDDAKARLIDSVSNAQRRQATTSYVASMVRWVNMYNQRYPADFKAPDGWTPQAGYLKNWKLPPGVAFPLKYIYGCAPGEEPTMIPTPGDAPAAPTAGPPGPQTGTPSCIPQPVTIPGNTPNAPTLRESSVMSANELPDYRPPFATGAVRADADGDLWIRTLPTKPVPGGPIYDIVNRKGELFDRLQLPPGYSLVGFGVGRVVYLSMRDAAGIHLARVRLR